MTRSQFVLVALLWCFLSTTSWTTGCGSASVFGPLPVPLDPLLFVSDRDEPGNWDIYELDWSTGAVRRLTTDPAIDNHPDRSHDGDRVVFSTTRYAGNDFDLAIADVDDIDGTAVRLTDDSFPNGPQTHYPDRHPHFSHDGELVVFTAKNRAVVVTTTAVQSECCVPIVTHELRYYENLCVIELATGTHVVLDPKDGLDPGGPNVWYVPGPIVSDDPVYVGHPTFSGDGTTILFTASVDGEGTVWNVFTVGFDPATLTIVPNSLQRATLGSNYPATPNPIKLSGGAHYSPDETRIYFSSTRTTLGNSQLFWTPAAASDTPVDASRLLHANAGNDYLPEPLDDGRIVLVSDLGPAICGPPGEGASDDLDLFIIDPAGPSRSNLTANDSADELLLIADEVSWFCGLKPNLTACTKYPRVFDTEALWLTSHAEQRIPDDLLDKFDMPTGAKAAYQAHWNNLNQYVFDHPHLQPQWTAIQNDANLLDQTFPGLIDPVLLEEWLQQTAPIRDKLYVLPSIMGNEGIGGN